MNKSSLIIVVAGALLSASTSLASPDNECNEKGCTMYGHAEQVSRYLKVTTDANGQKTYWNDTDYHAIAVTYVGIGGTNITTFNCDQLGGGDQVTVASVINGGEHIWKRDVPIGVDTDISKVREICEIHFPSWAKQ